MKLKHIWKINCEKRLKKQQGGYEMEFNVINLWNTALLVNEMYYGGGVIQREGIFSSHPLLHSPPPTHMEDVYE